MFTAKDKTFALIVGVIVLLDQAAKFLASRLPLDTEVPIIGSFFSLTHVRNTGAAFGIFHNQNIILIVMMILVLGAVAWYYTRIPKDQLPFVALICGGALGNLIDRIYLGSVIDFIHLSFWPAFNVADIAVTIGAILLVYRMWKEK